MYEFRKNPVEADPDVRKAIERRLAELQPAIDEAGALQDALDVLNGKRPRGAETKRVAASRRKAGAIRFVQANQHCRVTDVASDQGISGVRATQLLNELANAGAIIKGPDGIVPGPKAAAVLKQLELAGD